MGLVTSSDDSCYPTNRFYITCQPDNLLAFLLASATPRLQFNTLGYLPKPAESRGVESRC
jgi:hypothetical protein